jgi:hypothetical protein
MCPHACPLSVRLQLTPLVQAYHDACARLGVYMSPEISDQLGVSLVSSLGFAVTAHCTVFSVLDYFRRFLISELLRLPGCRCLGLCTLQEWRLQTWLLAALLGAYTCARTSHVRGRAGQQCPSFPLCLIPAGPRACAALQFSRTVLNPGAVTHLLPAAWQLRLKAVEFSATDMTPECW